MFSRKYLDEIREDQELVALRKEFYELAGKAASVELMNPLSIEEWKKQLKKEIAKLLYMKQAKPLTRN